VARRRYGEGRMLLSNDRPPEDLLYIHAYTAEGFVVGKERRGGSLIVGEGRITPWGCDFRRDPAEWGESDLRALGGELLIVGTGSRIRFLPHSLHLALLERFGGVEVMTTEAACRTYNVLVLEGRRVVVALASTGGAAEGAVRARIHEG
jgi:uncharacterized protein